MGAVNHGQAGQVQGLPSYHRASAEACAQVVEQDVVELLIHKGQEVPYRIIGQVQVLLRSSKRNPADIVLGIVVRSCYLQLLVAPHPWPRGAVGRALP